MPVIVPTDLEAIFHIDIGNNNDPKVVAIIERAQAAVEGALGRQIEEHEVVDTFIGTFRFLLLSEWPVSAITSVVENGVTLAAATDYRSDELGGLYRYANGRLGVWEPTAGDVVVTYTAGWPTTAVAYRDLAAVVLRVAGRMWEAAVAYAARPDGTDAVRQESIGSYSVTYASEVEGGKVTDAGHLTDEDRATIGSWR